ncbi:hypothetical protein [Anditalea andensis]|uniref:hypothetical protein n=1 Tax=Anditalea andensis TaxID=1048983 RepID=UPI0013E08D0C|nr:hypothetical protein [Anditalea andensis]
MKINMKRNGIAILKVLLFATTFIIASLIFKDWENFKRGLQGAPEIEKLNITP